ncbi:MAG: hypothetical protein H6722_01690 [Sandaracinus sp.]|nr:hypothetical protein [Sandaracinus sp.]
MYQPPDQHSETFRQGDVLRGLVLGPRPASFADASAIASVVGSDGQKTKVGGQQDFEMRDFMILSQCCDLADDRVLLAPLVPARSLRLERLADEQQQVVRSNARTVAELRGGDDETLVMPGYFYLASLADGGDDQAVVFSTMFSIRTKELSHATKLAELTVPMRERLRRRLGSFFSRIPAEDQALLVDERL